MANGPRLLKDKEKKKKLPKLGKLQKEADTLMQKIGKLIYPNSILGGKTDVLHHLIPKSVSAVLRYDWDNLIPLTNAQHWRLHASDDLDIVTRIIAIRGGLEWYATLRLRGRQPIKVDRAYYLYTIEKLQNRLDRKK